MSICFQTKRPRPRLSRAGAKCGQLGRAFEM